MGKIVIGLDLGIASVGYSVALINDSKNDVSLLERGSHLFPILSNPKTLNNPGGYGEGIRGEKRRSRRTIRRRQNRRQDFIKLINDYTFTRNGKLESVKSKYSNIFNFDAKEIKNMSYPIYELAVKGLKEELTNKELFKVLYSKLSFRGVAYSVPGENLEIPLAVELLTFLTNIKKVRTPNARMIPTKSLEELDGKKNTNETLQFTLNRNMIDIEKIIDNCSYLKNTDFKNDYLSIFKRVRDFSKGAGSEKSRTNGGIYRTTHDGKKTELNNMWEQSIGKCPVNKNDFRSLKCQSLPEIGNLISQLNSVKYVHGYSFPLFLTQDQKKTIIEDVLKNFNSPTPTRIIKVLNLERNSLRGFPTSKDGTKPNFEKMENTIRLFKRKILIYTEWKKALHDIKFTDEVFSKHLINFYDKDEIINANKNYDKSIQVVKELDTNKIIQNYELFCCLNPVVGQNKSSEKIIESINSFQKNNISGTHTFSLPAIEKYINENIDSQKTLSTFYIKEIREFQLKQYSFNKWSKYINNRLMNSVEFISPNIKNAMSETCKIFNKILKKYVYNGPKYLLDAIVIETTSDSKFALNGMQNNKELIRIQTENENKIKQIENTYPSIKKSAIEKIILLEEQDLTDLYDGKWIDPWEVINNPNMFEIDHILPIGRTQMNDRTNKVLTKKSNNQFKGDKTPVEWLSARPDVFNSLKKKWKDILERKSPIKLKNMLLENLSKDKEKSFIARNLTETQYIMKRIKNGFVAWKNFIKENSSVEVVNQIENLEILTVSGSVTQRLRGSRYLDIEKDRNISAEHHSVDASICAFLATLPDFRNTLHSLVRDVNPETGEIKYIYPKLEPKDIFSNFVIPQERWSDFRKIISKSDWLLSYKYMTLLNDELSVQEKLQKLEEKSKPKKISGETIYGWIENNGDKWVKERLDLWDLKENELKILENSFKKNYKDSDCLNSENFYLALQKIWNQYYKNNKENPFHEYMNDHLDDIEFQIARQLKQIKIIDGKLNATIRRLTFMGEKASIGLSLESKMAKNAFMTKLTPKCVYLMKNDKGNLKYLKEDWLNTTLHTITVNKWEILDVIEIGTIYNVENSLFRVTGCHKTNGYLELSVIHGKEKKLKKPYSSFEKMQPKKSNNIILKTIVN